jgi:hypothetical protein
MLYYSSPNLAILLNGKHLTEAFALEVNSQASVMPYYSWNSRDVADFTDGPIIVSGTLILNIKNVSYLESVIRSKDLESVASRSYLQKERNRKVSEYEHLKREIEDIGGKLALQENPDPNMLLEVGRLRKRLNTRPEEVLDTVKASRSETFTKEVDIEIVQASGYEKTTDDISGIRFTGKSFNINAGSSQNIKYAYPFIAKSFTA